jgi:anti-sigma factor RsiW
MAYVDGELDTEERREFELSLANRSDLRLEVARLRRLELLTRYAAGPEPMDHEWRELELDPVHRAGFGLGFLLLTAGSLALATLALYALWSSRVPVLVDVAITAIAVGFVALFLVTMRARMRTRHLDPYSDIER